MAFTNIDVDSIGQLVLDNAQEKIFPAGAIASTFGGYAKENDTIKVDALGESAGAAAYNASTNNYKTDRSIAEAKISVTANKKYLDGFSMTPTEFAALNTAGFTKRLARHVNEITRTQLVDLMGLVTLANFGAAEVVGAATAFDTSVVTQLKTNAKVQKFNPIENPTAIFLPDYYENLMEQTSTLNVESRGGSDVNRGGMLAAPYRGVDFMQSNIIPANGENLVGFVTNGQGLLMGTGVSDDFDSGLFGDAKGYYSEVFSTPEGLGYRLTINIDDATKVVNVVVDAVWGVKVGQASALVRATSV
jgi:hypothetical protein